MAYHVKKIDNLNDYIKWVESLGPETEITHIMQHGCWTVITYRDVVTIGQNISWPVRGVIDSSNSGSVGDARLRPDPVDLLPQAEILISKAEAALAARPCETETISETCCDGRGCPVCTGKVPSQPTGLTMEEAEAVSRGDVVIDTPKITPRRSVKK